jgi:hypothetical protein
MLDRLSPEKLADFMEHFDHYFEASGLEERANSAQRLPMGDGAGEQEKTEGEEDLRPTALKQAEKEKAAALN